MEIGSQGELTKPLPRSLPNTLTASRLILIPAMWLLAWLRLPLWIGIGVFVAFVTDVLDGYIARRLGQVSEFGSAFDSLADNLLLPSALAWLWIFRPEIFRDHVTITIVAAVIYCASIMLGILKFRRFANLHLQSSRAAAVPMYIFASHALVAGQYSQVLFYVAVGMQLVSSTETLLLQAISSRVDAHMGSLWRVLRQRGLPAWSVLRRD